MRSDDRAGLRIALAFAAALTGAEALDLQMSLLAPLVAGVMAARPPIPLPQLALRPVLAWLVLAIIGFLVQAMTLAPIALCIVLLAAFRYAFILGSRPGLETAALVAMVSFAVFPTVMISAPELAGDAARWCAANVAVACLATLAAAWLLPRSETPASAPAIVATPLPPMSSAIAFLIAVILVVALAPPAPGAVLITIALSLRADGAPPERIIRNRVAAAGLGGILAIVAWQVIWLAPGLPVLFVVTLIGAWLCGRQIARGGPSEDMAQKTLNAFAVLLGEGFSMFFEDTDDRLWMRLAGVAIGVGYSVFVLSLFGTRPRHRMPAEASRSSMV